jgi:hypothetical protein
MGNYQQRKGQTHLQILSLALLLFGYGYWHSCTVHTINSHAFASNIFVVQGIAMTLLQSKAPQLTKI